MRFAISPVVAWSPEVLPFAPRPMNGELQSSWARRLAGANGITLPEICACVGNLPGGQAPAAIFDYSAPELWRLAVARMARVPERWVWALDLQQQFPSIGREWFLHDPAWPEQIDSGFCPECFNEQIARRRILHLKSEWAVALVTRCFEHQLPLCDFCPGCGQDKPVHFPDHRSVQCLYCGHDLAICRQIRTPVSPEPLIVAFERAVIEVLAGRPADPAWTGECTPRAFRDLLSDLVWMFTTIDLVDRHYGQAIVDRIAMGRFLPRYPYGEDFEPRFHARPWPQREAVVCAIIQVLRGSEADDALGISKYWRKFAEFRPFVETLQAANRNQPHLWSRIRGWPRHLQDRAGQALRMVEWHRSTTRRQRRAALIRQKEAGTFGRPGV